MAEPSVAASGELVQHEDGRWGCVMSRMFPFGLTVRVIQGPGRATRKPDVWMVDDVVARARSAPWSDQAQLRGGA